MEILSIIIALILGLLVGSFLNVVIYRLPLSIDTNTTIDLINPKHSFCPLCCSTLSGFELIPVFSYLAQKGRCKHCHTSIGWHYPLIEIITALISALIVLIFGATIQAGFYSLLAWFLIPLFVIDLKQQLLPDVLTLPLLWIGLMYQIGYGDLQEGVIGAMGGYLFLWLVYWVFKLLRNKEGMGYGDFKLSAALGAWIGWQAVPLLLLVASVLSVVFFLLLRLLTLLTVINIKHYNHEVQMNGIKSVWAILKSTVIGEAPMKQSSSRVTSTKNQAGIGQIITQSTLRVTSALLTNLKLGQRFGWIKRIEWKQRFAFGPFLIVGFVVVLLNMSFV